MVPAQGGTPEDGAWIRPHSAGVEWLGRNWAETAYVGTAGRKTVGQELPGRWGSGAATGRSPGVVSDIGQAAELAAAFRAAVSACPSIPECRFVSPPRLFRGSILLARVFPGAPSSMRNLGLALPAPSSTSKAASQHLLLSQRAWDAGEIGGGKEILPPGMGGSAVSKHYAVTRDLFWPNAGFHLCRPSIPNPMTRFTPGTGDFRNRGAYSSRIMRSKLLIFCVIDVAFAQKTPPDTLKILEATAQKGDELTSYDPSAIANRPLGEGLTFRLQLVLAYAGPSTTLRTLPVPMISLGSATVAKIPHP